MLAFVSASRTDSDSTNKNKLTLMVSGNNSALTWNAPTYLNIDGENKHVAYLPPGITCLDPLNNPHCQLVWSSYDDVMGYIEEVYQVGIVVPNALNDPIGLVADSYFDYGTGLDSSAHIHVTGSPDGWFMTRLATAGSSESMVWNFKPDWWGISDLWSSDTNYYTQKSRQGFSVAYSYRLGIYRFAWTEE